MQMLAADRALGWRLGRARRARVVDEYDWEKKIDRILAIYQRLLGSDTDRSAKV
jgi:glycosyltransferase involved in cell wall biosynthesis